MRLCTDTYEDIVNDIASGAPPPGSPHGGPEAEEAEGRGALDDAGARSELPDSPAAKKIGSEVVVEGITISTVRKCVVFEAGRVHRAQRSRFGEGSAS